MEIKAFLLCCSWPVRLILYHDPWLLLIHWSFPLRLQHMDRDDLCWPLPQQPSHGLFLSAAGVQHAGETKRNNVLIVQQCYIGLVSLQTIIIFGCLQPIWPCFCFSCFTGNLIFSSCSCQQSSSEALDITLYLTEEPTPDPLQKTSPLFISLSRDSGTGVGHGISGTQPQSFTGTARDHSHTRRKLLKKTQKCSYVCCHPFIF